MKKLTTIIIIFVLVGMLLSACGNAIGEQEESTPDTPQPRAVAPGVTITPEQATESATAEPQASVPPKLTGEADDAPTLADMDELFGVAVSTLILKDTLEYKLPLQKPFAVVLPENTTKGMRWLLSSDDGKYQFIQEMPMDGYRAFLFEAKEKGEDYVVFELVENGVSSVETLNFQLMLGTAGD